MIASSVYRNIDELLFMVKLMIVFFLINIITIIKLLDVINTIETCILYLQTLQETKKYLYCLIMK